MGVGEGKAEGGRGQWHTAAHISRKTGTEEEAGARGGQRQTRGGREGNAERVTEQNGSVGQAGRKGVSVEF